MGTPERTLKTGIAALLGLARRFSAADGALAAPAPNRHANDDRRLVD